VKIQNEELENNTKAQNSVLKEFNYTGLDVLPLGEHIMLVIDMVQIWQTRQENSNNL
jgi:hypothetical protein